MGKGDEARRGGTDGEGRGEDTQVNTRECIVCGERAGSVAILRIAPASLLFPFSLASIIFCLCAHPRPPLPPLRRHRATPFCFSTKRVLSFRESSSRQERTRTLSSARHDKGELCTILPGRASVSLSLSLFIRNVRRVGWKKMRELAHSIFPARRSISRPDW